MVCINITCVNCGKPLIKSQIVKKNTFCSSACATSYRCRANNPDFFLADKHILSYILGLLFTDGNLNKEETRLTLSLTEKTVIEKLYPYFCNIKRRKIYSYKPSGNSKVIYTIVNSNVTAINSIINMGMTPHNSTTKPFPDIENLILSDFIRGIFDGDGCVYISNTFKNYKYYAVSISGASKDFIYGIKSTLENLEFTPTIVLDSRRKESNIKTYYLKINKQAEIKRFASFIYNNAIIKNNTKYEKFHNGNMI